MSKILVLQNKKGTKYGAETLPELAPDSLEVYVKNKIKSSREQSGLDFPVGLIIDWDKKEVRPAYE